MDPQPAGNLAAAVALVRRAYVEGLVARVDALEGGLRALGAASASAREVLRRQAHALRGSGTTFGFPGITEAATRAERASAAASDEELAAATAALVSALRAALATTPGPGDPP